MNTQALTYWLKPISIIVALAIILAVWPDTVGYQAAYLRTDYFIFVLLASFILLLAYIIKTPHLAMPWKRVFSNRRAMVAFVFLSVFVVIGLLDSIHFRKPLPVVNAEQGQAIHYSVEVLSVLDIVLEDLRIKQERTYSAPLAIYAYAKDMITLPTGEQVRDYPRLKHAGQNLDSEAERDSDIASAIIQAFIKTLIASAIILSVFLLLIARLASLPLKQAWHDFRLDNFSIPWRLAYITLSIVLLVVFVLYELSKNYHVFGTDKVGQDVLYLALKSIRTGLVIGTLTTLVMLPFAILLGIMAGYFRGWIDDLIQYIYTTLNSIPGVLLIAAAILSIQVYITNHPELFETAKDRADLRLLALCIILGITSWTGLCRLLRAETLKLRELEYIQAARAFGVSRLTIILRHILPNVMHIVLIAVVLDFSGLVLAEAVLAYVGIGVDPTTISWGNMINGARLELAREPVVWWSLVAAFAFMFTLVLSANLFSDAVRDAFDPKVVNNRK